VKGPRRNPWPWGIGIGLGVVVAVNALMIHIAISHPSAPASRDHYGESQRWDEVQAARGRSRALGWRVELEPCASLGADGCPLVLRVRDAAGLPVAGLHGTIVAQRADDPALDREAEVVARAELGGYEARLALARPGLYALSIRLEGGAAAWVDERRILVAAHIARSAQEPAP
jgi:nitrogen fixation protein FixH